jgi:hypothetical protein
LANVYGTAAASLSFTEYISSGVITPIQDTVGLFTPGVPLCSIGYTNGTGAGQVDLIYGVSLSLASTTQTIDLTSLTDLNGGAVNFARVREFFVLNTAGTAGFDLVISGGASNPWSKLGACTAFANGGCLWQRDPNSTGGGNGLVTAGGSKTVKFDSGSHTVTFYVLILGCSTA